MNDKKNESNRILPLDEVAGMLKNEFGTKITFPMRAPTRCVLWENPGLVKELQLTRIKRYIDNSHFIRDLLKCPECGQLYFKEFVEEIDWVKGEDPQYRTYVPVLFETEADALNKLNMLELLNCRPQLRCDWPSDEMESIHWFK